MKKLLAVSFTLLFCAIGFAQDIIVTIESARIDASIVEISETEVKYKSATNPDGPVFVIQTNQIASIIFKNGEVKTFSNASQKTTVSVREAKDIIFIPGQKLEKIERNGINTERKTKYYYGNIELDEKLYEDFLKIHCPAAYKNYKTYSNLAYGGGTIGVMALAAGVGCALWGEKYSTKIVGAGLAGVGFTTSIISFAIGFTFQAKSLDMFNEQCAGNNKAVSQLRLSIIGSADGLGLALNF